MDTSSKKLRHLQALSLVASLGPQVGGGWRRCSLSLPDGDGHRPREVGKQGWEGKHAIFEQFRS